MDSTRNLIVVLFLCISKIAASQNSCHFNGENALSKYLKPIKRSSPLIMAHQGGTENGYPGNSMAAFERTFKQVPCVLLEFDVRMTSDSVLVISHDNELNLRTEGKANLDQQKWEDVKNLKLKNTKGDLTESTIPTFSDVLNWSKKKDLILIVDKKPETDIAKTIALLKKSENLGKAVLICYSLDEAKLAHKLAPELMLAVGFNSPEKIAAIQKSGLPFNLLLALTPKDLQDKSFYDQIHDMNVVASLGANGNVDLLDNAIAIPQYEKIWKTGADIICTDNPIAVQSVFVKK